jgi:hypothetical protein
LRIGFRSLKILRRFLIVIFLEALKDFQFSKTFQGFWECHYRKPSKSFRQRGDSGFGFLELPGVSWSLLESLRVPWSPLFPLCNKCSLQFEKCIRRKKFYFFLTIFINIYYSGHNKRRVSIFGITSNRNKLETCCFHHSKEEIHLHRTFWMVKQQVSILFLSEVIPKILTREHSQVLKSFWAEILPTSRGCVD